jgi:hypothetical protein
MAFLLNLVELLLLVLVSLDTLGFIYQNRKNQGASNQRDWLRICYTWVFFLILRSLTCYSSTGYIANFISMLTLLGKIYISVPLLNGTEKLYTLLIEQNAAAHYVRVVVEMVKQKMNPEGRSE